MNIYRVIAGTKAEGPGTRFAIWVQGCSRHCPGCIQPETWSRETNEEISVEELFDQIASAEGIEGITVSGGEPFDQLCELSALLQLVSDAGLSTIVLTGYTFDQVTSMGTCAEEALSCIDVLKVGEYVEAKRSFEVPMMGSSNQRLLFLSDRYSIKDIPPNSIEVRIDPAGVPVVNGMGDFLKIRDMIGLGNV